MLISIALGYQEKAKRSDALLAKIASESVDVFSKDFVDLDEDEEGKESYRKYFSFLKRIKTDSTPESP